MKRLLPLMMVFLMGCSGADPEMEALLALRSRCLGARQITFDAEICADYIDSFEAFTLDCTFDAEGKLSFTVREPEEISGISGTVQGTEGTVEFDGTVLGFPPMAEGRLSPVSAPWVLLKALREGAIVAVGRDGNALRATIDDSYADNALTVDIWIEDGGLQEAEIAWEGRRCVTMDVDGFSLSA